MRTARLPSGRHPPAVKVHPYWPPVFSHALPRPRIASKLFDLFCTGFSTPRATCTDTHTSLPYPLLLLQELPERENSQQLLAAFEPAGA